MPNDIVSSTVEDLTERFEVTRVRALSEGEDALVVFRDALAIRLRQIIDHQFSKLAPLLYRIDVDERKVDEIMRTAPFSDVPEHLADLIIQRRLQAMETRRKYRES